MAPRKPAPDVDALPVERILRLLGLGIRSRGAVVGVERVRENAKTGKLAFAVVASDASRNSLDKLLPLLRARRINFIEVPSATELGAAVGREQTAAIGVLDRQLANGIRALTRTGSADVSEEGV
ncbi:MAG TPA: ribosomal L7Ae/L30e/S12e/Gadd45 family protein [Gemmatimonadaceae bacterium]|nr:ribosomal L7Ae/L30e/S12e/Gadd45 family protein [Gemmatimonadaceae bacterium]